MGTARTRACVEWPVSRRDIVPFVDCARRGPPATIVRETRAIEMQRLIELLAIAFAVTLLATCMMAAPDRAAEDNERTR
jgi:hypothetical protein